MQTRYAVCADYYERVSERQIEGRNLRYPSGNGDRRRAGHQGEDRAASGGKGRDQHDFAAAPRRTRCSHRLQKTKRSNGTVSMPITWTNISDFPPMRRRGSAIS